MRNLSFLFLMILLPVACTAQPTQRLTPKAFHQKINSEKGEFVILDVRTDAEVAEGKIKGAVQMNFNDEAFMEKLGKMDQEVIYYVYCARGGRSSNAVSMMAEMGFSKVYDLDGGIIAWQTAGYKVKK